MRKEMSEVQAATLTKPSREGRRRCAYSQNPASASFRASITGALLERPQIVGHVWILCRQRFDIADFDIDRFYTGPFGAGAQEPAPLPDHTRGMEGIAWDKKLDLVTSAQIRSDYDAFSFPGAIRWLLVNVTRTKPHVACGSSLRRARISSAVSSSIIWPLEHPTSNVQRPTLNGFAMTRQSAQWTSNLKHQKSKIAPA
jgi:hypothetical protein